MARAPSVWLRYEDHFKGDIIHQSVLVPADGATLDTYYCCMQWNAGMEGGGYCGIQDHPDGHNYIYSIWDPRQVKQPIKAAYKGLWTKVANFGGEGTGLRSENFSVGWRTDQWYTLVTRSWQHGGHTQFGFWVHNESDQEWSHIITMDYPVRDVSFSSATACFVEDWGNTGGNKRSAHYRHGYKRRVGGSWFPFDKADFSVVTESASHAHAHNYDGGVRGDTYHLSSGDHVHPTAGLGTNHALHASVPAHPTEKSIQFSIVSARPNLVQWSVPKSSTPQYKYTISVNGHTVSSAIDEHAHSHSLHGHRVGDSLEVSLEDILGNVTTHKTLIHK